MWGAPIRQKIGQESVRVGSIPRQVLTSRLVHNIPFMEASTYSLSAGAQSAKNLSSTSAGTPEGSVSSDLT